jgi:hypothetical protein
MPAALSNEIRIANGLRMLNCSGRSFVRISKTLGVSISDGPFSEGMRTALDLTTAEQLLTILERMRKLQELVTEAANGITINIDWSQIEQISNVLTIRLVQETAQELKQEDPKLAAMMERAMRNVTNVSRPA